MTHLWSRPPDAGVELGDRDVHIWRIQIGAEVEHRDRWRLLLADDECQRADRFKFQRDRDRFTVARGVLRSLLSQYLHCDPQQVQFAYGEFGKPELAPDSPPLQFNLSHSDEMALVACTHASRVGVDIERVQTTYPCESIARRFFSPGEQERLSQLPDRLKPRAFFDCWTRKEALIKALGGGLAGVPLDQFDVEFGRDRPAALLQTRWHPDAARRWSLRDLQAHPDYAAAAAVEDREVSWQYWDWQASA